MNLLSRILLFVTILSFNGYSQKPSVEDKPNRSTSVEGLTNEDALLHTVFFRALTLKDEANSKLNAPLYYLAVDSDRDLSKALLARLQKRWANLRNDSECKVDFDSNVVDLKTGERGVRISISKIEWINANEAKVETRDFVGDMGGHSSGHHLCKYTLRKTKNRWRIESEACKVS